MKNKNLWKSLAVSVILYFYQLLSFKMLRINYIRNNPLNFKSISHLDEKEAI